MLGQDIRWWTLSEMPNQGNNLHQLQPKERIWLLLLLWEEGEEGRKQGPCYTLLLGSEGMVSR